MGDQLKVDLSRLVELSGQLSRLYNDLDSTPSRFDGYAADMGNQPLAVATSDFGEDWTDFRRSLMADIGKLGSFAETAAKTHAGVDADLAKEIRGLLNPPRRAHGVVGFDPEE